MSAGFTARLVSMAEAESVREDILEQAPPDVKARAASCMRRDKAFQIAAADWYMRRMAAEEGLGTADVIRVGHEESGKPFLISGGERVGKHISVSHCGGYIYLCMADGPIGCDVEKIRGRKVCLLDDVVSTGDSLAAMEQRVSQAGAIVTRKAAILAEGEAAERKYLIFLQKLPLFHKNPDGTYQEI